MADTAGINEFFKQAKYNILPESEMMGMGVYRPGQGDKIGRTLALKHRIRRKGMWRGITPGLDDFGKYAKNNIRGAGLGLGLSAVMTVPSAIAIGARKGREWAAISGDESGLVGGFLYGTSKELGAGTIAGIASEVGAAIGFMFGGPVGLAAGAIGGFGGYYLGNKLLEDWAFGIGRRAQLLSQTGIAQRKLTFGTPFQDTQQAFTMRQLAVQEMAGSLLNARQFLGNEAYFLHR